MSNPHPHAVDQANFSPTPSHARPRSERVARAAVVCTGLSVVWLAMVGSFEVRMHMLDAQAVEVTLLQVHQPIGIALVLAGLALVAAGFRATTFGIRADYVMAVFGTVVVASLLYGVGPELLSEGKLVARACDGGMTDCSLSGPAHWNDQGAEVAAANDLYVVTAPPGASLIGYVSVVLASIALARSFLSDRRHYILALLAVAPVALLLSIYLMYGGDGSRGSDVLFVMLLAFLVSILPAHVAMIALGRVGLAVASLVATGIIGFVTFFVMLLTVPTSS
jgi:hypothetical protein